MRIIMILVMIDYDEHTIHLCIIINFVSTVVAARIIPSGTLMLEQNNYTLTCRVFVTNHFCSPSITYRWIKNNDAAAIQLGTEPDILPFYSLRLSDAGVYTCYATVSSPSLSSDISATASHEVKIQSEL
jgi:hypothetical protein